MIGFGEAIALFFRNYVNFEGRATRAEYWWPALMQILVYVAGIITLIAMFGFDNGANDVESGAVAMIFALVAFALVTFLPSIAVAVRRFHDLNQTGWLVLVFWVAGVIIPGAGIAQLIWFILKGTDGPNKYGPDPFGYDADVFG